MAIDSKTRSDPVRRRLRRLSTGERLEEAIAFLRQFARETQMPDGARRAREREVTAAMKSAGHYAHTPEELAFGARIAWRNHARCIGRLFWKSLEVVDCRHLTSPGEIAAQMFAHMREAYGDGRIRSMITVFAPVESIAVPVTIESPQIVQYAGYLLPDGGVLGDRQTVELTRTVMALGWRPPEPRGAFDVLPLLLRDADGMRHVFEVPPDIVHAVPIAHPHSPGLERLGLQWYSVPCVANMVMTIGGIDYPCAPFNGHYMATEIASRDLADRRRYDLLAPVAEALGLAADDGLDPLWRDTALTELNRAVLWSYGQTGVSILSHHEASAQYMEFQKLEQAAGRVPSGDWSWIVPPQASAACPVFHLPMIDEGAVPNFYMSRATDGAALYVNHRLERRNRWHRRLDRAKRRWRRWVRQRDLPA
jgi:nitric-oxide synthase, bacterial